MREVVGRERAEKGVKERGKMETERGKRERGRRRVKKRVGGGKRGKGVEEKEGRKGREKGRG